VVPPLKNYILYFIMDPELENPTPSQNPPPSQTPTPSQNPSIDKLTLELLLNKTHYQKYLSKTDPQKHAEYLDFLDRLARFREPVLEMTTELLDNPKKMYTNEVGDAFDSYVKVLVKYLEIEEANKGDGDDDELFPSTLINTVVPKKNVPKIRSAFDNWIPRTNR